MSIIKEIIFSFTDYDVLDGNMEKIASSGSVPNPVINELPEPYDDDFLYVRVRAISAGEYWGSNTNADYFSEKELRESYHTFLDAHVFKNHANKDVANAIGAVLLAEWNNEMKYVELLLKIDKQLAPTIVRGFLKGYTTDVSMGCRVKETRCSICGNMAKVRSDFCEHVRKMRNQVLPDGRKVFEYNIGPRFHDISVVLNGADRTAKVVEILAPQSKVNPVVMKKVASRDINFADGLQKVASDTPNLGFTFSKKASSGMYKLAEFKKEIIDKLYTLAILNRIKKHNYNEEKIQELTKKLLDTPLPLQYEMSKSAGLTKNLSYATLGTLGLAGATNYYSGKRLRGEELSTFQNIIADNPGVLPLAFLFAYPKLNRLKNKITNLTKRNPDALNKASENYEYFFSKEAADELNLPVNNAINILNDNVFAELFKKAYHLNDNKLTMIKTAFTVHDLNKDLFNTIKEKYAITDEDLNTFLKFSYEYIEGEINKEANLLRNILEMNLFQNPKIPTGASAPLLAGSVIDGLLVNKFFGDELEKNREEVVKTVIK